MIYMILFWILFLLFIIFYLFTILLKLEQIKRSLDENATLFFLGLASLIVIAIATKDPVTVAGINIPMEFQWLGSLLVTGFGAWKFYLHPLKSKVYSMDREVGEIKTTIEKVERNVDKITDRILNGKIKVK